MGGDMSPPSPRGFTPMATGSAPSYSLYDNLHPLKKSESERRLVVPSQRGTISPSRAFSFTVPALQKNGFFCLVSSQNIKEFLNQDIFIR